MTARVSSLPLCLHDLFYKIFYIFFAVSILRSVYDVVGFDQNLIIHSFNISKGVMVAHQISHAADLFGGHSRIGKKLCYQGCAFDFLIFSIGISIFFTTERAGDVMGDGGNLQNKLCLWIEPFQLADGFGIGQTLIRWSMSWMFPLEKVIIFSESQQSSLVSSSVIIYQYCTRELLGN